MKKLLAFIFMALCLIYLTACYTFAAENDTLLLTRDGGMTVNLHINNNTLYITELPPGIRSNDLYIELNNFRGDKIADIWGSSSVPLDYNDGYYFLDIWMRLDSEFNSFPGASVIIQNGKARFPVLPKLSGAAQSIENDTANYWKLSNIPGSDITFYKDGNGIYLIGVPDDCVTIHFELFDENNNSISNVWASPKQAFMPVDVEGGTYLLRAFLFKADSSGQYCYEVFLDVQNNGVRFSKSVVYDANLEKYSNAPSDPLALYMYTLPSFLIESDNPQIREQAKNITAGLSNAYDRFLAVNNWVCDNIAYDYDALSERSELFYSAAEVMEAKRSICGGISNLTVALLRAAGIPAKTVDGSTSDDILGWTNERLTQIDHSWTEAYIDGKWIITDTSWDTGIRYEFGKFTYNSLNRYYCDIPLEAISFDHRIEEYGEMPRSGDDKPSDWALAGFLNACSGGLITDELRGEYQEETTRAEFCRAVVNFLEVCYGKPISGLLAERGLEAKTFADTNDTAIMAASALGITSGTDTSKNLFGPDAPLTREQAAGMLNNTLKVLGVDTSKDSDAGIKDINAASDWARSAINAMFTRKIMSGTCTSERIFSPKASYTHEQSIITFNNLWNALVTGQ